MAHSVKGSRLAQVMIPGLWDLALCRAHAERLRFFLPLPLTLAQALSFFSKKKKKVVPPNPHYHITLFLLK